MDVIRSCSFPPCKTSILGACLLLTMGCGSDLPQTVRVTGEVTLNGKPLESGRIIFYPEKGNQALGEIVDGEYELRTFEPGDGAVPGMHKVTIKAVQILKSKPRKIRPPEGASEALIKELEIEAIDEQMTWITPREYSERRTTPLEREVKLGEDNVIDFELSGE